MKHRLLLMAGVALGLMGCEDSSYPPLKCPEILDAPLLGQEYTKQGLTRVGDIPEFPHEFADLGDISALADTIAATLTISYSRGGEAIIETWRLERSD